MDFFVARQAQEFAVQSLNDSTASIDEISNPRSSKQICDYYIGKLRSHFKRNTTLCEHCEGAPNQQFGRMIAPVWSKSDYYTFIVSDWYDYLSCGNNSRVSYVTVNSQTGKELTLLDMIDESDKRQLSCLLLKYLVNHEGKWLSNALTHEVGPYNAVIPYEDIRNENIPFRPDIDTFSRKAGL